MTKKTLSQLFEAMYHGKHNFHEFMSEPLQKLYCRAEIGPASYRREVLIPDKKLKIFHSFLNLVIIEFLPLNENVVFSYRKGFGVYDAVSKHSKSKYFFQTDVSSFFSSLKRELVHKAIKDGAANCPVADVVQNLPRILELICIDDALPVGFPCSAPMSNAALYRFDNILEKHCRSQGLIYTRYSDDIVISCNQKEALSQIEDTVQEMLHVYGAPDLHLNRSKSKYFQVGGRIKILGLMILPNGKVTVESKLKREIEALLYSHSLGRDAFLAALPRDEDHGIARITGCLNYINSVDKEYLEKLRRKFGATVVDTLLHRPLPKEKTQ
ncbi:reverse transcriptase domain-containing protein [Acidovorax sp. SUPP2539]|uniref:reverse transcriptase domain-containing protein n=1 Tax=Acidovorax sp. SUPP2539 TaxID=2920878 RepID=UPI0023DE5DC1|nr:reverse transcriptase domain-containing protein [Acidovorax sp. SUPP2539]GKS92608.1 retron St85 family RNA-directed DNA polymerase [Acidovorax sp. SUPP2539]